MIETVMKPNALRTLTHIVNELRAIEPDFPASYASVLLAVATHHERHGSEPNVTDIAHAVGIPSKSVGRIILSLSDRRLGRSNVADERPAGARKSLKLIDRHPDPVDLRMIRLCLTEKGTALLARMSDHIS